MGVTTVLVRDGSGLVERGEVLLLDGRPVDDGGFPLRQTGEVVEVRGWGVLGGTCLVWVNDGGVEVLVRQPNTGGK